MQQIKEKIFDINVSCLAGYQQLNKIVDEMIRRTSVRKKIGFIVPEFFHEDLNGFGGYGISAKRQAQYLNRESDNFCADVFLSSVTKNKKPLIKKYHDTDVLLRPDSNGRHIVNFMKYASLSNKRKIDILLSTDWYKSYEYTALSLPRTPLIIWIRDPRSREEWQKILDVPHAGEFVGSNYNKDSIDEIVNEKRDSIQKILQISKKYGRKVIFATPAKFLVERAKKAYGLKKIEAMFLPNTIEIPDIDKPRLSARPSLCFLGRLDPVKRPWIFCQLAEKFPDVDFLVAGVAQRKDIMEPVLEKYRSIPNLKFLGLVDGAQKHELLNSTWGFVNTSIHEALPVSFLEAFAYGKPVISCQDPDGFVSKFGYYTGEVLGEGLDERSIKRFAEQINNFLRDEDLRIKKGAEAREFVKNNYTLEKYEEALEEEVNKITDKVPETKQADACSKNFFNILTWLLDSTRPLRGRLGLRICQSRFLYVHLKVFFMKIKVKLRMPIHSREELPFFLGALGLKGNGVEVGVYRGIYSEVILRNSFLKRLYSIDSWKIFQENEYVDLINSEGSDIDNARLVTTQRLEKYGERSKIMRMTSEDAVKSFAENELDLIYIDAQHSYEACKEDISLWWPKLRSGGVFAGHDYINGVLKEGVFGVKRAVDEFVEKEGLDLHVINEEWPTWWLIK